MSDAHGEDFRRLCSGGDCWQDGYRHMRDISATCLLHISSLMHHSQSLLLQAFPTSNRFTHLTV